MDLKTITIATLTGLGATAALAQTAPAAAPEEPKKPKWESSAGLGLTLTRGNSENVTATANILTSRKWDKNELSLGADGAYGEADGDKNAQAAHGFVQYNRLFTERLYGYGRIEVFYDEIADLDYRISLSPGLGYYFIKNEKTTLSGEVGPGYVFEQFSEEDEFDANGVLVREGRIVKKDYATLRLAEKFEHKISATTRLWQTAEIVPQVDRFENYVVTAEIGLETSVSKNLNLRTYLQDIYRSEPAAGRKENDLKLVTALQYKF